MAKKTKPFFKRRFAGRSSCRSGFATFATTPLLFLYLPLVFLEFFAETGYSIELNNESICRKNLFGDYGYALITPSLQVKHWNNESRVLLLRVARAHASMVAQSVALITNLCNQPAHFQVRHVGGTLRTTNEAGVRILSELVVEAESSCDDLDD